MTEQEMRLMNEMLKTSLKEVIDPLQKDVNALKADVSNLKAVTTNTKLEIQKLKETDRKHSGVHREVRDRIIPRLATLTEEQIAAESQNRERDLEATATAYERMLHLHDDLAERLERTESELRDIKSTTNLAVKNQQMSLVQVPDGRGGVEVKAASLIAAQSSQKNEGAIGAIAIDTTNTKNDTTAIKKWTKFAAFIGVFVPVISEIIRHVFLGK